MADLKEKIYAEFSSIDIIISELLIDRDLSDKTLIELAGRGALLMNFYSGIENILKLILVNKGIRLIQSSSWHKELLKNSINENIIAADTAASLAKFLAFRHFFVHSYGFSLDYRELSVLIESIGASRRYSSC